MTAAQPDVVDVLSTDHSEFFTLIADVRATTDPQRRRDLADTLIAEIVRHSVAEEMHVYPAIKQHVPGGAEAVEHDTSEHKELERVMKQLEGADAGEPEFLVHVDTVERLLRDHVRDEESEQFVRLRASVPAEQLVTLAEKVETAKRLAPTRPHPASPNNQVFHKLVGPGVGLVDRLRDRLTGRSTG